MYSSRMLLVVFAFVSCSSAFNVAKVQPKVKMITYVIISRIALALKIPVMVMSWSNLSGKLFYSNS